MPTLTALGFIAGLFLMTAPAMCRAEVHRADIIIYGGTSSGIASAVATSRGGKSVLLLVPGKHLGGLTTGGLGATDIGNKAAIGGIAREFYERIHRHYAKPEAWTWESAPDASAAAGQERSKDPLVATTGRPTRWTFEPHVAMAIYREMLAEAKVEPIFGPGLARVERDGRRITSISMENGDIYQGRMFIDATYEGDLMAKAGVSYTVGRESNAQYGETLNGVRAETKYHQFKVAVDPYVRPGDPSSGLLPYIQPGDGGTPGSGDKAVQAYNYRLCMTSVDANRVPWSPPPGYDEKKYELLARYLEARVASGRPAKVRELMAPSPMPNGKTDTNNNGPFSTDFIGMNYLYPDGDYATRTRIEKEHENYIRGFLYFLSSNPRVPQALRDEMNTWGLAKDEFRDTDNFPPQMYVREARRMVSDYVMTEHDCRWERKAADGVGLGAYGMDSHNCQRLAKGGRAENEGDVEVGVSGPYPISYRSVAPKADECENLFVPVCLSATHIAYGSIRMEPVFMILGQSCAVAASMAIDDNVPAQKVDYGRLSATLKAQGQIISNEGFTARRPPPPPLDQAKLGGIIVDDAAAVITGDWSGSSSTPPFVGDGYLHDADEAKGTKKVRYIPALPKTGRYDVRLIYAGLGNRASNVPVTIKSADETKTIRVNQKKPLVNNLPLSLGVFRFDAGTSGWVEISNEDTDGYVIADAVQFVETR